MRALLDVNVLIALLDAGHVHHASATQWLRDNLGSGWASCPLTQNGCVRILSQPAYPRGAPASDIAQRLAEAGALPAHEFWPDDISLIDPGTLHWDKVLSGRHLTDLYLLTLAVRHAGRLVTLDQGIPLSAVPDARPEHLMILSNKTH